MQTFNNSEPKIHGPFCFPSKDADDSSLQSHYLARGVLLHRIEGLDPDTTYIISIHAVYSNTEGPEISLSQLTGRASASHHDRDVRKHLCLKHALAHGLYYNCV